MTRTESGTPLMRNNSRIADGTVLIILTSPAAGRVGSARAFLARTTLPPQQSGTNNSKIERSKQTEVDARTPESSCWLKTLLAQETIATALRCSSCTPLGLPVEPE